MNTLTTLRKPYSGSIYLQVEDTFEDTENFFRKCAEIDEEKLVEFFIDWKEDFDYKEDDEIIEQIITHIKNHEYSEAANVFVFELEYEGMTYFKDEDPIDKKNKCWILVEEVEEEIDPSADFYAIQTLVDGFGHDTSTLICFKTLTEAQEYTNKYNDKYNIVPQYFGEEYEERWG